MPTALDLSPSGAFPQGASESEAFRAEDGSGAARVVEDRQASYRAGDSGDDEKPYAPVDAFDYA
jgi:hypothetical protein